MKNTMTDKLYSGICFFFVFGLIFFVGCKAEQTKPQKKNNENIKILNEILYREKAVLLSIKYNIDEKKILNMLADYHVTEELLSGNKTTVYESLVDESLFGKNKRKKITGYSQKYDIKPDVIAKIFIDFLAMKCSNNE